MKPSKIMTFGFADLRVLVVPTTSVSTEGGIRESCEEGQLLNVRLVFTEKRH
ncbi:MAG: hypothetical protein IPI63_09550 [Methanothrix sp.]|uniref:hypothetical protein n=1 Tax=Methanothrix sp. TaxID=90426 RepID=UPI0025E6CCED|nr:hypothetical protein [Methanothrix sp.]MBK7386938.1 hypothetical protein [Methanothrix sp.]